MNIRISELMDEYSDDSIRLPDGPVTDAEKIREMTMEKLGLSRKNERKRKPLRLFVMAAAAVLLLAGTAVAVYHLTLEDRLVKEAATAYVFEQIEVENPSGEMETQTVMVTAQPSSRTSISVQGAADSPESRAYLEWKAYTEQWRLDNPDWSDAYGGDDSYYETPENYAHLYGAFLQEQAEALDGIMEKYGLSLHERREWFESERELCAMLGCEDFLSESYRSLSGYCFEDGSFKVEGWWGSVGLSLISTREGSFSNIGGLDPTGEWFGDYEQWSITAEDGTELLLILGDYRSQVLAQLPDAALSLAVYAGRLGEAPDQSELEIEFYAVDAEKLEEIALAIDYDILASYYETPRDITANMDAVLAASEQEKSAETEVLTEIPAVNTAIAPWDSPAEQEKQVLEALGDYSPEELWGELDFYFTSTDLGGDAALGRVWKAWMIPEDLDRKTDFDLFLRYEPAENFKTVQVVGTDETGAIITEPGLTGWPVAKEQVTGLASAGCTAEEQTIQGWEGVKTVREDGTIEGLCWYDEDAGLIFWMINNIPDMSADEFLAVAESMEKQ